MQRSLPCTPVCYPVSKLELPQHAVFTLADAADVALTCERGSVWITLDGDTRDVVLAAGERFVGDAHRRDTGVGAGTLAHRGRDAAAGIGGGARPRHGTGLAIAAPRFVPRLTSAAARPAHHLLSDLNGH